MGHEVLRGGHAPSLKPAIAPTFQFLLYRRALHPELFQLKGRRVLKAGGHELEAWLMPRTHVIRYQHKAGATCELVTDREDGLPTNGAVATFPCLGEKDFEQSFTDLGLTYVCNIQAETLSENLYKSTLEEMTALADETDALCHTYEGTDGGACLSMLDVQRYENEFHVQSYHLCSTGGLVLRTQTIFEFDA
ncbi:MAG: DUF2617 family protein [Phycisphaerales bacterium]